jgi:hypothetical protein
MSGLGVSKKSYMNEYLDNKPFQKVIPKRNQVSERKANPHASGIKDGKGKRIH